MSERDSCEHQVPFVDGKNLCATCNGVVAKPEPEEHIMQFFGYAHLPARLQAVSRPFCELAEEIVERCPRNPERTVALRKLLESKDAAVRAVIAKGNT